ncbi:MAG: DUF2336 domain-containing protein, partial [Alphaproteobacteria bacterium]|nr:DUF2336 domain-containing protein [Alphaproteobacteria bacterium]
ERLAQRRNLDEDAKAWLARQVRIRAEEGELEPSQNRAAFDEVDRAAKLGTLDEDFVEAAAEAVKRETIVFALARLARCSDRTVRRILLTRSAKPVTALCWRAGLSMRASFKIQRFVMKLPADELLPARGGVGFPLREEEMGWHLSYFGVGD